MAKVEDLCLLVSESTLPARTQILMPFGTDDNLSLLFGSKFLDNLAFSPA